MCDGDSVSGRSLDPVDQCHRRCRRAHLGAGDHVDEDIACAPARRRPGDGREIVRRRAGRPGARTLCPEVERACGIARRLLFRRALQPGIDEVGREVGDQRMLGGLDEHDRDGELAQQRDERRYDEARVPHLDHVAQRLALELAGQEREKAGEIVGVEFLPRVELPEDRPELGLELRYAARKEALDRIAGLGEDAAMGGIARPLEREHEIIRRLARPFAKALRLLRAGERAVDLDRGQLASGIFELARLRDPLGIELPPPGCEYPAADADTDHDARRSYEITAARQSYFGNTPARSLAPCKRTSSSILASVAAMSFATTLLRMAMGLRS